MILPPYSALRRNLLSDSLRAAELFAGVGGFRLGLEKAGWEVTWSNQWEPATKAQHASDVYVRHFGHEGHVNESIVDVLDRAAQDPGLIPDIDLVVGGFPCQDYSVAKTANMAAGLEGKKGVLWWEILRLLKLKTPSYVLLENVDRLLKSPTRQRGRDFAVILACLNDLGYTVEWRVINAADYGFAQRRRRVFIVAYQRRVDDPLEQLSKHGVLARALPCRLDGESLTLFGPDLELVGELDEISDSFGLSRSTSPFQNAGIAIKGEVWTRHATSTYRGRRKTLGDVLTDDEVPEEFFIPRQQLKRWKYLKGAKNEARRAKNGHEYTYNEGPVAFPDPLDKPSRTVLTGEGGSSPSRFKHVIQTADGRFRRLTPIELERLNGFPDDWTAGLPNPKRAFLMGNALVVGIVHRIAAQLRSID